MHTHPVDHPIAPALHLTRCRRIGVLALIPCWLTIVGCQGPGPRHASATSAEMNGAASFVAGYSVEGRPITGWTIGNPSNAILVFGGIHGDESASTVLVNRLIESLRTRSADGVASILIATANPDGLVHGTRENARGVDLNRNFPAANWRAAGKHHGSQPGSEPETQALMSVMQRYRPRLVVSVHCIHGPRECNNYDGPGRGLAEFLSGYNGYPTKASIGYATPGSFGSWVGVDQNIPVLTLELPRQESARSRWEENLAALAALLRGERDSGMPG